MRRKVDLWLPEGGRVMSTGFFLQSNETILKLNGDGCTALGNKPRVAEFYYKSRYQKRAKDDTAASAEAPAISRTEGIKSS